MIEIKTLDNLLPGDRGIIVKVGGASSINQRILSMGITGGVEVEVERMAPLGDPIEIKVLDYHLSLRKKEAKMISVEVNMIKRGAIPLMKGKSGDMLELVSMADGTKFQKKLAEMGLERGTRFKLLHAGEDGPITILLKGREQILGSGMVKKIFVKRVA